MIDELLHLLFTNPKKLKPQEWRALIKMFCTDTGDFGIEFFRLSYFDANTAVVHWKKTWSKIVKLKHVEYEKERTTIIRRDGVSFAKGLKP